MINLEEFDRIVSELFGDLVEGSDIELMNIFLLNALAVKTQQIFLDKYGQRRGTHIELENILSPANISDVFKVKIINRVQYWLNQQIEKNWTVDMGYNRSRKVPKSAQKQGECAWPGCKNTGLMELDHKFPFSLGGDNDASNFQTLCRMHNLAKGNSIYSINEWPTD